MQNLKKKCMPAMLLLVQNWGKIAHLPQEQGGLLLEIPYTPLLSVMTLHYHRLYQISSLEADVYMKQLCRSHLYRYTPTPKLIIKPDLF